jgi:hypothetical protein
MKSSAMQLTTTELTHSMMSESSSQAQVLLLVPVNMQLTVLEK